MAFLNTGYDENKASTEELFRLRGMVEVEDGRWTNPNNSTADTWQIDKYGLPISYDM